LVRNDKRFKELGLVYDNYQSKAQVAELLLKHPELMQRPVVIVARASSPAENAVIARPPEKLLPLLD
jgi:arsenate reductase